METFSEYQLEKEHILNSYTLISNSFNYHLFSKILEDEDFLMKIKERIDSLNEERYTVAVCGQIKSGKSTLLNALIFGKIVLPMDDTPHTAKITIIKDGEPGFEATFYTKSEYDQIKNCDNPLSSQFESEIEECLSKGAQLDKLLGTTHQCHDLNELSNYVAKNGKYTVLVNTVTVYYPCSWLKDTIIADTPGTNDSNPVRDQVTKSWIHKADAVLYCTYAGRVFDNNDLSFIDNFMFGVTPDYRLFATTKIDCIADADQGQLDSYLEQLVNSDINANKRLIRDKESIISVSPVASLILKLKEQNIELSDDLEFLKFKLEEKGFLDVNRDGMHFLKKALEKRLLKNKGNNIIVSHKNFLKQLFKKCENNINYHRALQIRKLENFSLNLDEIKSLILKIKGEYLKHKNRKEHFNAELQNDVDKVAKKVEEVSRKFKEKTHQSIEDKISNCTNRDQIQNELWTIMDQVLAQSLSHFINELHSSSDSISQSFKLKIAEFTSSGFSSASYLESVYEFKMRSTINESREKLFISIETYFSKDEVREIISDCANSLGGLLFWKKNDEIESIKSTLRTYIFKFLKDIGEEFCQKFRNICATQADIIASDIAHDIELILKNELKNLELAEQEFEQNEQLKRDCLLEIQQLDESSAEISKLSEKVL